MGWHRYECSSLSNCQYRNGSYSPASTADRKICGKPARGAATFAVRSPAAGPRTESSRPLSAANGELCKFGLHSASISCQPSSSSSWTNSCASRDFPMPGSPVRQTVRALAPVLSAAFLSSSISRERLTNCETLRVLRIRQLERSLAPVTRYTGTGSVNPLSNWGPRYSNCTCPSDSFWQASDV